LAERYFITRQKRIIFASLRLPGTTSKKRFPVEPLSLCRQMICFAPLKSPPMVWSDKKPFKKYKS